MIESASSMAIGRTSASALILAVLRKVLLVLYFVPIPLGSGKYVHLLDLVISHGQAKLSDSCLDRVPTSQTRGEVDVARQTKVGGVQNLICAGVVEDGLGVDTGLVGEGTETGDRVVERSIDLDGLGNHVLNLKTSQLAARKENSSKL